MSPQRADAYRRVLETLAELGPSKLLPEEQDRIRSAADELIFSAELDCDRGARDAVEDIEMLRRSLVSSGRWELISAEQLAADVLACGPPPEPLLSAV